MEVQTPNLSKHTASDPFLDSYHLSLADGDRYLQTSPEFHMKRLLATAQRPIFQICQAFRRGETGRLHNSEFTMIEWYAPGTSASDMAELTSVLVDTLYEPGTIRHISFNDLIWETQGIDVSVSDKSALLDAARRIESQANPDNVLDCLYENALSLLSGRVLVHEFPACLASLAALNNDGNADRFEFIVDGVEIANGCQELTDAEELQRRTERNNDIRRAQGLAQIECDQRLVAALQAGIEPVSGVALGFDRLLMLKLGKHAISKVLTFPDATA